MQTLQKLAHSHQEIELMHERLTWDYCCDPANMYKLQNIFIFAKHICIVAIVQYGQHTQYTISLGLLSCEDWGKLLLMPNATRLIVFRDRSNVIRVMVFLHTIHGAGWVQCKHLRPKQWIIQVCTLLPSLVQIVHLHYDDFFFCQTSF